MKRAMIAGLLVGVTLATSGAVLAGFASRDRYAEVLDVQPVTHEVRLPRRVCGEEAAQLRPALQDERRVAGTAAAGEASNPVSATPPSGQQRCRTVQDIQHDVVGYDVRYRLGDTVAVVRSRVRPPERIPVRDGRLLLETAAQH